MLLSALVIVACNTKGIEDAAVGLSHSLDSLAKVDPVGLNRLIKSNDSLRTALTKIELSLNSALAGTAQIVLKNSRLRVRASNWRGQLVMNAWIDDTSNWFMRNTRLNDRSLQLAIPVECAETDDARNHRLAQLVQQAGTTGGLAAQVQLIAQQKDFLANCAVAAQHAFSVVMAASPGPGIADSPMQEIQSQFLQTGQHQIWVSITPVKPEVGGPWEVSFVLEQVAPDGSISPLKTATLSSLIPEYADAKLNKPILPIAARVAVQ
jgi:hypothetical protein